MEHRQGMQPEIFRHIVASATAFVICSSISLAGKPAHADAPSPNLHNDKIHEFVSRIEGRWGITVSPADYEVATIEGITVIRPKDARLQAQETQDNNGDTKFLMSTTADTPPAPASGGSMADSQTDWRQPTCWARLENFWAWMDMCSQWGLMTYAGETRRNYAYKMYASCGITDIDRYRELTSCYEVYSQAIL
ncbi:hypothetical protein O7608_03340 [Solwaraspora sp. WMMA2056]|uniref:hypothetical protein n=1 Tax=Solwaraspora sp. WMMA2056 TaxID=3015161 RepID=UPI00259BEFB0|nr:hypothetical protein [Solwaraspora sp. WMMA2056]WJK41482.1 hypothetical protein O7608_03340 [Solwaraspora sp. WMMA2056]